MAKVEGLTFKDLIDAQKRLADKGDARAKEQVEKLGEMAKALENQGEALTKQSKSLGNVEKNQKLDKAIQVVQTKQQADIVTDANDSVKDEDKLVKLAETLNKTIKKGLIDKGGDGLNSNVIKMFKEIKNLSKLTPEQSKEVLGKSGEKREFKTIGSRLGNFKEGVKDFFTARGFLDKTGIVKRGSGGIFSEALDAREARQQQAKARIESGERARDPVTGKIVNAKESQKQFEQQAKQEQVLRREQGKLERKIEKEYSPYLSEEKIGQTKESKRLKEISEELVKVNPSLAPEGYQEKPKQEKQNVVEFAKPKNENQTVPFVAPAQESENLAVGTTSEESMAEAAAIQKEQLNLLEKIEENTRPGDVKKEKKEDKKSNSLFDGFKNILSKLKSGIFSIIKTIGPMLMRAVGPLLAIMGQVALVGAAVYGAAKLIDKGFEAITGKSSDFYNKDFDEKSTPKDMQEKLKAERLAGTIDETSGMGKAKARTMADYEKQLKETGKVKNVMGQDITEKAKKDLEDYKQVKEFKEKDPYQQYKREVEAKDFKGAKRPTFEEWKAAKNAPVKKAPMTSLSAGENKVPQPAEVMPSAMTAAPQAADTIYNKSAEVAPSATQAVGETKTLVNAPTTINKSTQTNYTKLPVRNYDPSYVDYIRRKFVI